MKLFLDTADTEAIRRAHGTGMLDGVTTNPTHIAKAGRPYAEVIGEICAIVSGPVSVEAVGRSADELVESAKEMRKLGPNVNVKIPMTVEGIKAVRTLEDGLGIRTNVTMIFSSTQAYLALKAGAMFVSIVLSRLDAVGNDSETLIRDAVAVKRNYGYAGELLAGSVKTVNQVLNCLRHGVDIATLPETLFFQLYEHPLTAQGIAQFEKDWQSAIK